jgi:hypothetical protein
MVSKTKDQDAKYQRLCETALSPLFYGVQNKLLNLQRKKAAYGGKLEIEIIIAIFALLTQ